MAPSTTPKRVSNPSTSAHPTIPVPMPPIFSIPAKPAPHNNALEGQLAAASHRAARLAINRDLIDPESDLCFYGGSKPPPMLSNEDTKILDKQYWKLARARNEKLPESSSYLPIAIILNVLSLAHNTANPLPRELVIVHILNPDQYLFGDEFDARLKPDIIAYISTLTFAQEYLSSLKTDVIPKLGDRGPLWSQLSAVAELKVAASPEAQLLHYVQTTLRYRPDLSFVMGLSSRSRGFAFYRLSPVNASVNPPKGREPYPWTKKSTHHLQKYIAAIYHAEEARYNDMTFKPENGMIWTLVKESAKWEIFPFHCGVYPGRGTWIGAAVKVGEAPHSAIRIAKLYWVDVRARWEEGQLYEQAHALGVIPGLATVVQHWKTGKSTLMSEVASPEECESTPVLPPLHSPEPVPAVEEQESKLQRSQQIREQYCVMLGTHGKPLNNCETVLHILKAIFDLLVTHRAMCEQDILHRDISWGNVLVDPVYDTEPADPGGSEDGRYWYSASIFGDASPHPKSLLMDLDQACRLSGQAPKSTERRQKRTGTPMFIATEITTGMLFTKFRFETSEFLEYFRTLPWKEAPIKDAASKLVTGVLAQLEHLETNNPRMTFQEAMMASSSKAPAQPAPASSNTPISHEPQHDAESVFWLLWFLLARANPKDHSPAGSHEQLAYDDFCNDMLSHTVGNMRDSRYGLMTHTLEFYEWTLHPQFKSLGKMLYWMGNYLQVPRHKWAPTHQYPAHDMMQLLLLAESVRIISSGVADIRLDTTQPRPATRHVADIQATATVKSRTAHSYRSDSQGVSVGQGVIPTFGSGGQKQKRTAKAGDNVPNTRHSGNPFDGPSSSTRQKMKDRLSNPEGSGAPNAPMEKVPTSFPQRKPQRKLQQKPRTSSVDPFQTRSEHNPPSAPNESGDKLMDESTEKEIAMEFQTQIDTRAQYKSEESHAQVTALEEVGREQVPLPVEVASKMQKEMFQSGRWFTLRAQKVN